MPYNINNAQFSFHLQGKCYMEELPSNQNRLKVWHYDNLFCYQSWDAKSYNLNASNRKTFSLPVSQFVDAVKVYNIKNPDNPYQPTIVVRISGNPAILTVKNMHITPYSNKRMDECLILDLEFNYEKVHNPNEIISLTKSNLSTDPDEIYENSSKINILFSKFGYRHLNYNNYMSINNLPFSEKDQAYDPRYDISALLAVAGRNYVSKNYLLQDKCFIKKTKNGFTVEISDPNPLLQYQTWNEFTPFSNSINNRTIKQVLPIEFAILLNEHDNYLKSRKNYLPHSGFGYEPTCLITLINSATSKKNLFVGVFKSLKQSFLVDNKISIDFSIKNVIGRGISFQSTIELTENTEYEIEVEMDGIYHENPNGYEYNTNQNIVSKSTTSTTTVTSQTPAINNYNGLFNINNILEQSGLKTSAGNEITQSSQLNETQICNLNALTKNADAAYESAVQGGSTTQYAATEANTYLQSRLKQDGLNGPCTDSSGTSGNTPPPSSGTSSSGSTPPPSTGDSGQLLLAIESYMKSHPPPTAAQQFAKQLESAMEIGPFGIIQFLIITKTGEAILKKWKNRSNKNKSEEGESAGEAEAGEAAVQTEVAADEAIDQIASQSGYTQMMTAANKAGAEAGDNAVKALGEGASQEAQQQAYMKAYNEAQQKALNEYKSPETGETGEQITTNTANEFSAKAAQVEGSTTPAGGSMPPETQSLALESAGKKAGEAAKETKEKLQSGEVDNAEAANELGTQMDEMGQQAGENVAEEILEKEV